VRLRACVCVQVFCVVICVVKKSGTTHTLTLAFFLKVHPFFCAGQKYTSAKAGNFFFRYTQQGLGRRVGFSSSSFSLDGK
jgi:hypothetical protein